MFVSFFRMTSRGRLLDQALQDCTISTGDYVVNHDGSLSFINNAVNHNEEAANLNEDETNFVENSIWSDQTLEGTMTTEPPPAILLILALTLRE